jgi:hypothetical protein
VLVENAGSGFGGFNGQIGSNEASTPLQVLLAHRYDNVAHEHESIIVAHVGEGSQPKKLTEPPVKPAVIAYYVITCYYYVIIMLLLCYMLYVIIWGHACRRVSQKYLKKSKSKSKRFMRFVTYIGG